MATVSLIHYEEASPEVKAIFDDIKRTRQVADVNNFWKALANQPDTLKRTWEAVREVMRPGALDDLTKEMIYIAVSVTNNCEYCVHSHTASAFNKGMARAQYQELIAVIAMAHQTNALANALRIPVDGQYIAE
jgi:AhpD family alkylhydroperoxidase